MKKCLALLLSFVIIFTFFGCGTDSKSSVNTPSDDKTYINSETVSEYPSSDEISSFDESSSLSSIESKIESANESSRINSSTSSKNTTPSSKNTSSKSTSSSKASSSKTSSKNTSSKNNTSTVTHDQMKAVWISYLEFSSFKGSSEAGFTSKIKSYFTNVKSKGLNTVIVQVRPHGDSFYDSAYYPWSKWVSGTAGEGVSYDPLAIMVKQAHAIGLSIHAWINPYRTMNDSEFSTVPSSYKTKKWYESDNRDDYMIQIGSDKRWWLKPGNKEVQALITNGVKEIVSKYKVDGIHLDDYFYGTSVSEYGDTASEAKANTTALVKSIYNAIKSVNSKVVFGISPAGGFLAKNSLPNSDYGYLSTNLNLWCKTNGYIDYVMPQIYWGYDHPTQPFATTLAKWESFVTASNVKLYIGIAASNPDISVEDKQQQMRDALESSVAKGYCLYRYAFIDNLTIQ